MFGLGKMGSYQFCLGKGGHQIFGKRRNKRAWGVGRRGADILLKPRAPFFFLSAGRPLSLVDLQGLTARNEPMDAGG